MSEYTMLNRARDHVHNWDASPDLEDFVNSHIDELERHVAVVIERTEESSLPELVSKKIHESVATLGEFYSRDIYDLAMSTIEPAIFKTVLEICNNNQSKAATMLGLARGTFRTRLEKYGILNPRTRSSHGR